MGPRSTLLIILLLGLSLRSYAFNCTDIGYKDFSSAGDQQRTQFCAQIQDPGCTNIIALFRTCQNNPNATYPPSTASSVCPKNAALQGGITAVAQGLDCIKNNGDPAATELLSKPLAPMDNSGGRQVNNPQEVAFRHEQAAEQQDAGGKGPADNVAAAAAAIKPGDLSKVDLDNVFKGQPDSNPTGRAMAVAGASINQATQNGDTGDAASRATIYDTAQSHSELSLPGSRLALAGGDHDQAAQLATAALRSNPHDVDALSIRGAARMKLGDFAGAHEDALAVSHLDPNNKLGQTVLQYSEALAKSPGAKTPDGSALARMMSPTSAGSLAGGRNPLGGGGQSAGLQEGASRAGMIGAERSGKASYGTMSPSNRMAADAEGLSKIGDVKGALRQATFAIDADKSNPEAYAVRAGIWNKSQRYLLAQQDANTALGLDPYHVKARNARAFAYNMTGHPAEAQQDALKILAADPRNAMGYLNLAMSQEAQGQPKEAAENYKKAAQLDPTMKVFYDEFLSKHPELLGGGAAPILTQAMKALPSALRTPARIGGLGILLAALAAGGFFLFKRRPVPASDESEDADADTVVLTRPAEAPQPDFQGAETIALSSGRAAAAMPTVSGNGAPTIMAGVTGPAGTTLPAGATVRSTAAAVGPNGGMLIARNYEVRKELGRGGMGVVYEAFDLSLGRKVAIKEMRPEIAQSIRDKDRFMSEARTVAKFQHPNIVSIYSILEENGRAYLVFEHVEGNSLDKILDQHRKLGPEMALPLFKSMAAALDYSHSRKVIHRDLKPANVMITDEGVVKVMDFGIAHEAKQTVSRLTNAEAFGTMAYMPPEQELGQASKESDVFAFAVLAYETMVGKMPFPGPNYLAQKKGKTFAPPSQADPSLPKALDAVFDKALEPEAKQRHSSAGQFASALAEGYAAAPK